MPRRRCSRPVKSSMTNGQSGVSGQGRARDDLDRRGDSAVGGEDDERRFGPKLAVLAGERGAYVGNGFSDVGACLTGVLAVEVQRSEGIDVGRFAGAQQISGG